LVIGDPLYIRNLENIRLSSLDAARNPMSYNRDNGNGAEGFSSTGKIWMHLNEAESLIEPENKTRYTECGWEIGRSSISRLNMSTALMGLLSGEANGAYGKIWMTDGIEHKFVDKGQRSELIILGWTDGMRDSTVSKISAGTKEYYAIRSESESQKHRKNLSIATANYHANLSDDDKEIRRQQCSLATKKSYNNKTNEEKHKHNMILNGKNKLCIHCGIKTNHGNFTRWHGDKCKTLK
jgi:hypothetical protein